MRESDYQARLIRKLRRMFPGCVILKNDSDYLQGIPDLTILYGPCWAVLEVKAYDGAPSQPNQEYYVDLLNGMSYASFICPENETDVLRELQAALEPSGQTRVSQRQQLPLDQLR